MKTLLSSAWPSIIWTSIIFILLVIPTSGIEPYTANRIPYFDKYVHVLLFTAFGFLWITFLSSTCTWSPHIIFMFLFAAGTLYGLALEFVQKYFTERNFSLFDTLADALGTLIGLLVKKSPYGNRGRNQN